MSVPSKPALFLGSSAEGREVARNLQAELGDSCEVVRWDQGVFGPSGYTLESLLEVAARVDFAVVIATPDDTTRSRGTEQASARDNIVLEFGLFAGALGRERTYLLATGDLKLPTDVLGLTRLPYHPQPSGNGRAAVTEAALQIEERLGSLRRRDRGTDLEVADTQRAALRHEIDLLCKNAVTQGWTVKTDNTTTLRLVSRQGRLATLSKGPVGPTRADLRRFAAQLRGFGLRVNNSVRRPAEESPF